MHPGRVIGLVVALTVLIAVGPAVADSSVDYLDGAFSNVFDLGGGLHAFVFYNDLEPPDIFVHAVDLFANLLPVSLLGVNGYAFYLKFEGVNQGFDQYGVFACTSFFNQVCNVNGVRQATLFL